MQMHLLYILGKILLNAPSNKVTLAIYVSSISNHHSYYVKRTLLNIVKCKLPDSMCCMLHPYGTILQVLALSLFVLLHHAWATISTILEVGEETLHQNSALKV